MAEIKMDVSEYELLKENKKLLEDSLKKERELSEEIAKLKEEKIKALEDAKMKVIKINKQEITEYRYINTEYANRYLPELIYRIQNNRNGNPLLDSSISEEIFNKLFKKVTSISTPINEITTIGLDEVKKELREDIESKINKDIQNKLSNADKVLELNNKLTKEIRELDIENNLLLKNNKSLKEELEIESNLAKSFKEDSIDLDKVSQILLKPYNFWNSRNIVKEIKEIINLNNLSKNKSII